jgi:hypothetical protein
LNIENRSKNPLVCGINCTPFLKRFVMSVSTSALARERGQCWCGLRVEVHYVKRDEVGSFKKNVGHFTDLSMRSLQTRQRKITSVIFADNVSDVCLNL